jgi:5'-methylthioadenosine phosphorylase
LSKAPELKTADVGIIGGTGIADLLASRAGGTAVPVQTPYGPPSSDPMVASWEGINVAFIARHGRGHRIPPSAVPYRANIFALKTLGVSAILATGATGSLREDIEPGHLVLCDQVIDRTYRRATTFFDEGTAVHVEFADPFCPSLRADLARAGSKATATLHHAGTYVCMEGPQFSTRAESNMHRQWGGDLIGMTCMPEAKLAREAEMCYALIAFPTDYDCWRPADPTRGEDNLLQVILSNLDRASRLASALIQEALKLLGGPRPPCRCGEALKQAVWTDRKAIDATTRARLQPFLGRYLDE